MKPDLVSAWSMKSLGVFLHPPGWDAIIVPHQKFPDHECLIETAFANQMAPFCSNCVSHI